MKRFSLFLFVCIMLLASETIIAQTASDYYLPLNIGSHLNLYGGISCEDSMWSLRTTTYTIEGTDLILGQQYFREVAREISACNISEEIYRVLWLRKDSLGEVIIGAVQVKEPITPNIDSATIIHSAFAWIPNQFLTPGYKRDYSSIGMPNDLDSVMSITESVNVPAGTFTNCVKICQFSTDNLGNIIRCEYDYYAKGIGLVKDILDIPVSQSHTSVLIGYGTTGVGDKVIQLTPRNYSLSQNFPNPFNPVTTINYSIAKEGNVKLSVYDVIGNKVATIVNEYKPAGSYSVQFDGSNLASGIYLYRLETGNYSTAKKFILMK